MMTQQIQQSPLTAYKMSNLNLKVKSDDLCQRDIYWLQLLNLSDLFFNQKNKPTLRISVNILPINENWEWTCVLWEAETRKLFSVFN